MLDLPFFRMLAEGPFTSVIPHLVAGHMKRSPESEQFIEEVRRQRLAQGIKSWPNDEKPSRFHYVEAIPTGKKMILSMEPCVSYNDHAAGVTEAFAKRFAKEYLPASVATTILLESQEHMLLAHRQKGKVDYKEGGFHFSNGGFITIKEESNGDPTHAVLRELDEEAGVMPDEVMDLKCLGVAWDPWQHKPDVLYSARTNVSIDVLRKRKTDKENVNYWMNFTASNATRLLRLATHSVVPMGMAALLLVGRERFGEKWFRERESELLAMGAEYHDPVARQRLEKEDIARAAMVLALTAK